MQKIKKIFDFIIDVFFPPSDEELKLRRIPPEDFIAQAKQAPFVSFLCTSSLFAYKDPLVRELIWQIKYKRNVHAVLCAAFSLHKKLCLKYEKAVLIPIPISKERRRERGYNQCELIVDEIIKLDTEKRFIKRYDILFRRKHVPRQTDKSRKERLKSITNIFKAEYKVELENETLIIIDDVLTTGSTTKEARQTLLSVNYKVVEILTIAH